jgi:hypothetical protein
MTLARRRNYAAAMRVFRSVYTSNYDLTAYWAYMEEFGWFVDYFWGKPRQLLRPGAHRGRARAHAVAVPTRGFASHSA